MTARTPLAPLGIEMSFTKSLVLVSILLWSVFNAPQAAAQSPGFQAAMNSCNGSRDEVRCLKHFPAAGTYTTGEWQLIAYVEAVRDRIAMRQISKAEGDNLISAYIRQMKSASSMGESQSGPSFGERLRGAGAALQGISPPSYSQPAPQGCQQQVCQQYSNGTVQCRCQ